MNKNERNWLLKMPWSELLSFVVSDVSTINLVQHGDYMTSRAFWRDGNNPTSVKYYDNYNGFPVCVDYGNGGEVMSRKEFLKKMNMVSYTDSKDYEVDNTSNSTKPYDQKETKKITKETVHKYYDAKDKECAQTIRKDYEDGSKSIYTATVTGEKITNKGRTNRLYNSQKVKENVFMYLVVEGESQVDELENVLTDYVMLSWQGGCGTILKADWTIIPKGSKIVLCPDNDDPGRRSMMDLSEHLLEKGYRKLRWIDNEDIVKKGEKNNGGDLLDLRNEGVDLKTWIQEKQSFIPIRKKETDLAKITLTDTDIAIAFINEHQHILRFNPYNNEWYHREEHSQIWRNETPFHVKAILNIFLEELKRKKVKAHEQRVQEREEDKSKFPITYMEHNKHTRDIKRLGSYPLQENVYKNLKNQGALHLESNQLDLDPYMIGAGETVIDLRNNKELSIAKGATKYITRSLVCVPEKQYEPPEVFLTHLYEMTQTSEGRRDVETVEWIKRWMGQSLLGTNDKSVFLFLHGSGTNGKTKLVNILKHIFADYSEVVSNSENIKARLQKMRLIMFEEPSQDSRLHLSIFKSMTGEGFLTARKLGDSRTYSYQSSANLLGVGNSYPQIGGDNEAMRRRFFTIRIHFKADVKDLQRGKKMIAESGRILAWILEGCSEYVRLSDQGIDPLEPSPRIKDDTEGVFSEQDVLQHFLNRKFEKDRKSSVVLSQVYQEFQIFLEEEKRESNIGSVGAFSKALGEKGFTKKKKWDENRTKRPMHIFGLRRRSYNPDSY